MSHSLRLPGLEPEGVVQVPGSTIQMKSDPTGAWQSLESHGSTDRFRVAYVIGSGAHASGYIVSLDNHLFQSPVAYYRRRAAYGLAPGFENKPDPDFTRPIEPGCLFCHAGEFTATPETQNEYASEPFSHLSIDCTRCHGPIEAHLKSPNPSNIVNPPRLDPPARDSVCEQCHLKGVARVLNPGKTFADFVPGQPLEQTFTIYHYAAPEGAEVPFKVISHSEEFALSKCKRVSADRMWCGTCHNPHDEPMDPVRYYRSKCLECHANTHWASNHPPKDSNCIGCHMPRKQTDDGGHTVFTDHRIQRKPGDSPTAQPTKIQPWREPPSELVTRNFGIASVRVGMEHKSAAEIVAGYRALTEVQHRFPQDSEMYGTMGDALFIGQQYEEAIRAFELAVRFDPKSSPNEASLGSAYEAQGQHALAEIHLGRALELDPLNLSAAELLIALYEKNGEAAKADALRGALAHALQSSKPAAQ
ncbi:MAG TPA: hypothetical protein VK716_04920 [Terracidiphilus sp.]|nr:hypothetical protein [Terracidiphilus sp.]